MFCCEMEMFMYNDPFWFLMVFNHTGWQFYILGGNGSYCFAGCQPKTSYEASRVSILVSVIFIQHVWPSKMREMAKFGPFWRFCPQVTRSPCKLRSFQESPTVYKTQLRTTYTKLIIFSKLFDVILHLVHRSPCSFIVIATPEMPTIHNLKRQFIMFYNFVYNRN